MVAILWRVISKLFKPILGAVGCTNEIYTLALSSAATIQLFITVVVGLITVTAMSPSPSLSTAWLWNPICSFQLPPELGIENTTAPCQNLLVVLISFEYSTGELCCID